MTRRIRHSLALVALLTLLKPCTTAMAADIVVPNANATIAGNLDNQYPLLTGGMRYQQVFDASQFSTLGGPTEITGFSLRNGNLINEAFTATIASIQIALSTTSQAPDGLSTTFADNTGADVTTVFDGMLTISSTNADGPGGTKVFDINIHFQHAFVYDPSAGNLLLDIKNISGADSHVGTSFFDAEFALDDSISRVSGDIGDPDATTGVADTLGLIVQFHTTGTPVVPEPASLLLAASAAAVVVLFKLSRLRGEVAS